MDTNFSLQSPIGNFNLTADPETMMVYVEKHRDPAARQVHAAEIPSWCFDREAIWFYFGAPEPEDKVSAGERIKTQLLEYAHVAK
jgi:hypothetical protein